MNRAQKRQRAKPIKHERHLPPMLIQRTLHNQGLETREWLAVDAMAKGYATTEHYDLLAYLMNLLLLAGSTDKSRQYAHDYAEQKIKPVLQSIEARWHASGKFGVTGPELNQLRHLVEFNKQFWLRQNVSLFDLACKEVDAFFKERSEARERERLAA
jgi:hypothetical protein